MYAIFLSKTLRILIYVSDWVYFINCLTSFSSINHLLLCAWLLTQRYDGTWFLDISSKIESLQNCMTCMLKTSSLAIVQVLTRKLQLRPSGPNWESEH